MKTYVPLLQLFTVLLFFFLTQGQLMENEVHVDPNYSIYWTKTSKDITIEVQAKGAGWLAIGFDPDDNGMENCDMIIYAAPSPGVTPSVKDYWSTGYAKPIVDRRQSLTDIYAGIEDGVIYMQFTRLLNTGDHQDKVIKPGKSKVVWAYGDGRVLSQHANDKRGLITIDWLQNSEDTDKSITENNIPILDIPVLPPAVYINSGSTQLSPRVLLGWKVDRDTITFNLTVKAHAAWIAVGFDPLDDGMMNADMVVGRIRRGEMVIDDYFSTGYTVPRLDNKIGGSKDVTLVSSASVDDFHQMIFSRKLDTNDPKDHIIHEGRMKVVWAYGTSFFRQHALNARGMSTIDFLGTKCSDNCNGNGICKYGLCECYENWSGADCALVGSTITFIEPLPPAYQFPTTYANRLVINPSYTFYWNLTTWKSMDAIAVKITTKSNGWVGVGFEPDDRAMKNADFVIGKLVNDQVIVEDYFSKDKDMPSLDSTLGGTSDIFGRGGKDKNGFTWIEFVRPIAATDFYDKPLIPSELNKVVWAFGNSENLNYHGKNRGFMWVDLFNTGGCPNDCTTHGFCNNNGECECNEGWTGPECSESIIVPVQPVNPFPQSYSHMKAVNSNYLFYWNTTYLNGNRALAVKIHAKTHGWVGMGFNPEDRAMKHCDLVIGTVKDGEVTVADYFSITAGVPSLDTTIWGGVNSVESRGGFDSEGNIWIEFVRPVVAEDAYDRPLQTTELNKVVWAFGIGGDITEEHLPENRGFLWVDFFDTKGCPNNCSGNGACNNGVCVCSTGFIGEECVKDETIPAESSIFPKEYTLSQDFENGYTLYWKLLTYDNIPAIAIKVTSKTPGWVAIGFEPSDEGMTECDMVIGVTDKNGNVKVSDYWSSGYRKPVIDSTIGGTSDIISRGGKDKNGNTWIEFIRPITAKDTFDKSLVTNRLNEVVWAFGTTPTLSMHLHENRGFEWVDFFGTRNCKNQCSNNGKCHNGNCECIEGWIGPDCSIESVFSLTETHCPNNCSYNGNCDTEFGKCICHSGWKGVDCSTVHEEPKFPDVYTNTIALNEHMTMYWQNVSIWGDPGMSFLIETDINGWIGIGFQPDDYGMLNADMVIATINGSNVIIEDYWSTGHSVPTIDTTLPTGTNDLISRGGMKNGHIWIEFMRTLDSTDNYDKDLNKSSLIKFVWAFGNTPDMKKHTRDNRGFVWIDLFENGACPNDCSSHGSCDQNECTCENGWITEDCSVWVPPPVPASKFPKKYNKIHISPTFKLYWKKTRLDGVDALAIRAESKSHGWVGVGFEPEDRGMKNCDMIIGTIIENIVFVDDYYSSGNKKPVLDTKLGGTKDILSRGGQTNETTWIEFIRPLVSSDKTDTTIDVNSITKVVWAVGHSPELSKHTPQDRGFLWVDFFNTTLCPGNCSGIGICEKAVCKCPKGWIGEDCSIKAPKEDDDIFPFNYENTKRINPSIAIYWTFVNVNNIDSIAIRVESDSSGWIGIGFQPEDNGMRNSDMVIGEIVSGHVVVDDYWSTGNKKPVKDTALEGSSNIISRGGQTSSSTWIEFIRPINATEKYDKSISMDELTGVTWAIGDTNLLSQHVGPKRGFVWVDFGKSGLCVNNCSQHGTCKKNRCKCDEDWIGEDCSINAPQKPSVKFPATYTYSYELAEGVEMFWKLVNVSGVESISILLECRTEGWIGLGIEPSDNGMSNSDMIIGTVISDRVVVEDYWSFNYSKPQLDTKLGGTSDIVSRGGKKQGITWIEFIKPLLSMDKFDSSFDKEKLAKITWAFGETRALSQHMPTARGTEYIDLFNTGLCPNDCSENGKCNNGQCLCNENWVGIDCSYKLPIAESHDIFPDTYSQSPFISDTFELHYEFVSISNGLKRSFVPNAISVLVTAKTNGWVGIGFMPDDEGMANADMVIATVGKDGRVIVGDYFSTSYSLPILDTDLGGTNDLVSRGGQRDGKTWFEFVRPLVSTDSFDKTIPTHTVPKIVWAFGSTKGLSMHAHEDRGLSYVDMFKVGLCPNNCSNNGECIQSKCRCSSQWTGSDCSKQSTTTIREELNFPDTYDNMVTLDKVINLTLSWTSMPESDAIAMKFERRGRGWIALGIAPDDGGMKNADMIIATINGDEVVVQDYWSSGYGKPLPDVFLDGHNDILKTRFELTGKGMVVEFIRPISSTDQEFDKPITDGEMKISYAYGSSDYLTMHHDTDRAGLKVDFSTGSSVEVVDVSFILRVLHGALMFAGWGFFLLIGVLMARYGRDSQVKPQGIPLWFFSHRILQYLGFVLTIGGFIVAFVMTQVHFNTLFHAQLGCAVMGLAVLQVVFAFFRPHPPAKGETISIFRRLFEFQHRFSGRFLILASAIAIISGLWEMSAPMILLYICAGYYGLVLLIAFILEIMKFLKEKKKEDIGKNIELESISGQVPKDPMVRFSNLTINDDEQEATDTAPLKKPDYNPFTFNATTPKHGKVSWKFDSPATSPSESFPLSVDFDHSTPLRPKTETAENPFNLPSNKPEPEKSSITEISVVSLDSSRDVRASLASLDSILDELTAKEKVNKEEK